MFHSCTLVIALAFAGVALAEPMQPAIARRLHTIFAASEATGMVAAFVDAERTHIAGFGVARVGEGAAPDGRSLLRINSLTKVMTGELLARLVIEGRLALDDPLQRYAPPGRIVPRARGARAITLMDLAAHTSGLPRDLPPGLSHEARWAWLERFRPSRAPGRVAEYSNAAYMFLGDALARAAGESFAALIEKRIAKPLGFVDTTLAPTPEQCRRLMTNGRPGHPCAALHTLDAMGGVYSTADDMARWMRVHLTAKGAAEFTQAPLNRRTELRRLVALDFAGETEAIAMGWLWMRISDTPVLQKTGGGGHFMNYVILAPSSRKGLFITVTRSDLEMLRRLTNHANELMADLIHESGER